MLPNQTKPNQNPFHKTKHKFFVHQDWGENLWVIHTTIWTFWKKRRKNFQTYKMLPNQPKPISQDQTQVFVHQDWGENLWVIHTTIWTLNLQTFKMLPNQLKPISQNQTQIFVHQDWGEIVGNPHKNLNLKPSNV